MLAIHPGLHRRFAFVLTLGLMLVVGLSTLTMAAPASTALIVPNATLSAHTESEVCTDSGACEMLELSITTGNDGESPIACVRLVTGESTESGCASVASAFSMDAGSLAWAELSPMAISLFESACDGQKTCQDVYTRTIFVAASWAGSGDLVTHKRLLGHPHGICSAPGELAGFVRTASVSVSVDGQPLGTFGDLRSFDSSTFNQGNCTPPRPGYM